MGLDILFLIIYFGIRDLITGDYKYGGCCLFSLLGGALRLIVWVIIIGAVMGAFCGHK